jgi:hypothetical protein
MLATAILTVTTLVLSQPVTTARATYRVPQDYPNIQLAIAAANDGDEVLVGPGTYIGGIDFGTKRIRLASTDGQAATILDGNLQAPVVRIRSGADRSTIIQGFSIRRGRATEIFEAGGIVIESGAAPIIVDNWIYENSGVSGNAISANLAAPQISANWIHDNTAGVNYGGAIYLRGSGCIQALCTEINGNLIERNFAGEGGAIYAFGGQPTIVGNRILQNSAFTGGAVALINTYKARVENNLIVDNGNASGDGGAIYWLVSDSDVAPFVIGNTMINNKANIGSAVHAEGFHVAARLVNNIIVSDMTTSVVECNNANGLYPPIVRHNNLYAPGGAVVAGQCAGLIGVSGNISAPPVFAGGYQLQLRSAGVDAGNRLFTNELKDLNGLPRILDADGNGDAQVDMGAFEVQDLLFKDGFE